MHFGVVLQNDPPAKLLVDRMVHAEQLGFTHGWTFDSTVLWQEPFVIFEQILARTERLTVGPLVTNPGTRDLSVLASLFATLNDCHGNRTVCAIGRGDSALRVVGRKPQTLAEVERAIRVVKDLAEGRTAEMNGVEVKMPWVHDGSLPMWMAAYGPKALKLVGEHADGFVLQCADPDIARWTIGEVKAAAKAVGRDPDAITVCVAAPAYLSDVKDLAHQRDQCRWFGGMVGNHVADLVARYGEGGAVPKALTDYIKGREGYDYSHHGRAGNPSTDFVPDEIVDRFCLVGDAEAHRERLAELRELGVDQFALYLMHDQIDETMEAYGREVIG